MTPPASASISSCHHQPDRLTDKIDPVGRPERFHQRIYGRVVQGHRCYLTNEHFAVLTENRTDDPPNSGSPKSPPPQGTLLPPTTPPNLSGGYREVAPLASCLDIAQVCLAHLGVGQ